jgi:hypothetical protein
MGINLRVTSIMLPPTVLPGAHEDHPRTEVGRYVGSKQGFLKTRQEDEENRESLDIDLFVT